MDAVDFDRQVGDALERVGLLDAVRRERVDQLMSAGEMPFELALQQVEPVPAGRFKMVLEEVTGTSCLDPSLMQLSAGFIEIATRLLPPEVLVVTRSFPVQIERNRLHLAMRNPTDTESIDRLEGVSGMEIEPHVAPVRGVDDVLEEFCRDAILSVRRQEGADPASICMQVFEQGLHADMDKVYIQPCLRSLARLMEDAADEETRQGRVLRCPELILLVHQILNRITRAGASDVHVEPQELGLRVRARIDGVLQTLWEMPRIAIDPIISRLKVMSHLDPAPSDQPLDGHIEYSVIYGMDVEFRVSILPALFGEKAVLRVLDRSKGALHLQQLGFEPSAFETAERAFKSANGLILVTGPTGSGKTTTLYSALDLINDDRVNIVTAEDPVESKIAGTTQVHCSETGVTFAGALRSFLRQDPDIIMVGEIRDAETAEIALKASLTGHLVLSTLHTNDAAATIMRLANIGLEPYLIGSALRMIVAQRLVRKLCSECRCAGEVDGAAKEAFSQANISVPDRIHTKGDGCPACHSTGYKGRSGLYEVLIVQDAMELLVSEGGSPSEIRKLAREQGVRSLFEDGLLKVAAGLTSMEELYRVTAES